MFVCFYCFMQLSTITEKYSFFRNIDFPEENPPNLRPSVRRAERKQGNKASSKQARPAHFLRARQLSKMADPPGQPPAGGGGGPAPAIGPAVPPPGEQQQMQPTVAVPSPPEAAIRLFEEGWFGERSEMLIFAPLEGGGERLIVLHHWKNVIITMFRQLDIS